MQASKPSTPAAAPELSRLRQDLNQAFHDLNQPLSAIGNYAQAGAHLIDNGLADPAQLKELFGKIAAQGTRATALAQELRAAVTSAPQ